MSRTYSAEPRMRTLLRSPLPEILSRSVCGTQSLCPLRYPRDPAYTFMTYCHVPISARAPALFQEGPQNYPGAHLTFSVHSVAVRGARPPMPGPRSLQVKTTVIDQEIIELGCSCQKCFYVC